MASAANRGGHVQQLLGAYVLGGLSTADEAAVRAHLDRCAQCTAEYDELSVVPSWLDLLGQADAGADLRLVQDWGDDLAPDHEPADQEPDRPGGADPHS